MSRVLSRNECSRIRYKAKTLGATSMQFHGIPHVVNFDHTYVTFSFFPLKFSLGIKDSAGVDLGLISIADVAADIKKDIDSAFEFALFLEKIAQELKE